MNDNLDLTFWVVAFNRRFDYLVLVHLNVIQYINEKQQIHIIQKL